MIEKVIFWCLIIVLLWSPLPFGSVEGWSNGLLQATAIILSLLLSISSIWKKEKIRFSFFQIPMFLVIIQGVFQYFFISIDPYQTKLSLYSWLGMSLFFWLGLNCISSSERLKKLVNILVTWGTIIAMVAILQQLTANNKIYWFREIPSATPFGPFVNRNHYAGFMELLVPLPIALLLTEVTSSKWKNLYLISSIIMVISLVLSSSRAGLVCLIVEISLLIFLIKFNTTKQHTQFFNISKLPILIGTLFVALVVSKATSNDWVIFRLTELNVASANNNTLARTTIWNNSLQLFYKHPVLGVGLGAYPVAYTQYDSSNGYLRVEQAHNDYLQVLTDLGVLGGMYMLGFLFLFFKYSLKTIFSNKSKDESYTNYKIAAFVGCCAIFIHSFFDFNLQIPSNAFLFLVLCLCSTLQFSENIVLEKH